MIPLLRLNSTLVIDTQVPVLEHLNQSTEFCSQFENGRWYCYILLVLFSFALPVGIVGNIAALFHYTCFWRTGSTSNIFLLNLALCDLAWILMLPFTIYFNLEKPYHRDIQIFCQLKKIFFNINIYGSVFFLTLISFDRYARTVHPISSLRWWGVGKAKFCSACTWVAIVLTSIPDSFVTFAVNRPGNATVCMGHLQGPFVYVATTATLRTLLGFALPFGITVVLYVLMLRVLRGLARGKRRGGGKKGVGKPTLLIAGALLVFMVSYAPYHIMIMTVVYMRSHDLITAANSSKLYASFEFSVALSVVGCCLDPVLYILASERFLGWLLDCRRGRYKGLCCRAKM
ncbi:lysophosphatidic acid receptor 6-like [Osmerus eperlanus]|uniref:lysophosphatidic acid receptor 6-like n=1 Tax=Osmerus eperlanus TaxID=29151 RepID=UPI002E1103EA